MSRADEHTGSEGPGEPGGGSPDHALTRAVYGSDINGIRRALEKGADLDEINPVTGLAALHLAVGLNDLAVTRFLLEECGAHFRPDRHGRWPTLIAAENRVDDELSDYIVTKEAEYLAAHPEAAP